MSEEILSLDSIRKLCDEVGTLNIEMSHLKTLAAESKQKLRAVHKNTRKTNKKITRMYYLHLEATKVIQTILDQPGVFKVGRLVCKKWNNYLTSKVRPNLILSLLIRQIINSKNDPYWLFPSDFNKYKLSFKKYYANQMGFESTEDAWLAFNTLDDIEKERFEKKYDRKCDKFNERKDVLDRIKRRKIPKLNRCNQKFYDFLVKNMFDHPMGPPLFEIYNKSITLFTESIGRRWHVVEGVLPFIETSGSKIIRYLPLNELFPECPEKKMYTLPKRINKTKTLEMNGEADCGDETDESSSVQSANSDNEEISTYSYSEEDG